MKTGVGDGKTALFEAAKGTIAGAHEVEDDVSANETMQASNTSLNI